MIAPVLGAHRLKTVILTLKSEPKDEQMKLMRYPTFSPVITQARSKYRKGWRRRKQDYFEILNLVNDVALTLINAEYDNHG